MSTGTIQEQAGCSPVPSTRIHTDRPEWHRVFLAALASRGDAKQAAKVAGIDRVLPYRVRKQDEWFAARWKTALKRFKRKRARHADDVLYKLACEGWQEPVYQGGKLVGRKRKRSIQALGLYLGARHPAYKKAGNGNVSITVNRQDVQVSMLANPRMVELACQMAEERARMLSPQGVEVVRIEDAVGTSGSGS